MQVCYDGEAFRRVLAMAQAAPDQRARAALGLTRPGVHRPGPACARARAGVQEWQAQVLERVEVAALPTYLRNSRPDAPRHGVERAGVPAGTQGHSWP